MDTTQILIAFFGGLFGILLAILGFFVKRTVSRMDRLIELMPTLLTIPEFEKRCGKAQADCREKVRLKEVGEEKLISLEEKTFREKWDALTDRLRKIERHIFKLYPDEAGR
jgi:hypothetical protein